MVISILKYIITFSLMLDQSVIKIKGVGIQQFNLSDIGVPWVKQVVIFLGHNRGGHLHHQVFGFFDELVAQGF